ncbi:MAG: hypothetical protein RL272_932 [Candidatus Parcubacteria bacterium]
MLLRTRLLAGLAFFFCLYGFGMVLSLSQVQTLREFAATTPRIISLLAEANEYGVLVEHTESQVDDFFIADFPGQRTHVLADLQRLDELGAEMTYEARSLKIADPGFNEVQSEMRSSLTGLLAADRSSGAVNDATLAAYSAIKSSVQAHQRFLEEVLRTSSRISIDRESAFDRLVGELVLIAFAMFLSLVGLTMFLIRVFIHPLKKLMAAAENVRRGEFGKKTGIETTDELGQLAAIIDGASESLRKKAEVENRAKELEAQIEARATLLERKVKELETINATTIGRELKMIELKKRIEELEHGSSPVGSAEPTGRL